MGFLFQLLTGSHLRKHVGIAVFCATDGSATEEPGENVVLLLTAADLRRAPEKEAPDGVEVLPIRLIEVAEERPEMDEPRVLALAERDPAMGAAFEKLQTKAKVQEPAASKLGGAPSWVQSDDTPRRMRFVAQLDFDEQDIDSWEDAGLNGALFVFVSEDEKKATAFWQYT